MIKKDAIHNLVKEFSGSLTSVLSSSNCILTENIQSQLQELLSTWLHKMDLVTRQEFDIQSAVLRKTRIKLDILEQAVQQLVNKP